MTPAQVLYSAIAIVALQLGSGEEPVHSTPVPQVRVAAEPQGLHLSEELFLTLAYRASGSREWAQRALSVARCESRLRSNPGPGADGELGLMQIHPVHRGWLARLGYPWQSMLHPGTNLRAAWMLWQRQGWGAWRGCL